MLKLTTKSGAQVFIDEENKRFKRIPAEANWHIDWLLESGVWENYILGPDVEIGKSLYIVMPRDTWYQSTPVVTIEELDEE